jgi:hypothetical protein
VAKVKPSPKLEGMEELERQLQNVRSVIFEAKATIDAVDLALCRAINRLATAKKEEAEGAWGEKP